MYIYVFHEEYYVCCQSMLKILSLIYDDPE